MDYSTEIAALIKKFLDEDQWGYEFREDIGRFTGGINVKGKISSVRFSLMVKKNHLQAYIILPIRVEEKYRPVVAEYLTRANYGLIFGAFEMDFEDGEIRYRITVSESELKYDLQQAMWCALILPCRMVDRYGDGLLAVMFGMSSPEDAIAEAEADNDE